MSIPQIRSHSLFIPHPRHSALYIRHAFPRTMHVASYLHYPSIDQHQKKKKPTQFLFICFLVRNELQLKGTRSGWIYFQSLLFVISAVIPHLTLLSSLPGSNCWITDGRIANHSLSVSKCRQTYPINLWSVFLYWKQNQSRERSAVFLSQLQGQHRLGINRTPLFQVTGSSMLTAGQSQRVM